MEEMLAYHTQDLLLDIPTGVASAIFTEWLELFDISNLDCAYCSTEKRPNFLQRLSSEEVVFTQYIPYWSLSLSWIVERSIRISHFVVDEWSDPVQDKLFHWFKRNGKHILKGNISGGTEHRNEAIVSLLAGFSPCLLSFTVSGFLSNEALGHIYTMSNLHELSLLHSNLPKVAKCRTVKIGSTGLRALNLGSSGSDALLHAVAASCPELMGFSLSDCERITAKGILDVVSKCKDLRTILIRDDDKVNDSLMHKIVALNDKLECIRLSGCKRITDAGIIAIATKCHSLQDVDISLNENITDDSLYALAEHCPLLESLDISGMENEEFTDDGVVAVATHCPCLESINLELLYQLTDESIIALAKHCPRLLQYELYDLYITDNSLLAIAEHRPDVAHVGLMGCRHIGTAGLFALATKCTELRSVTLPDNGYIVNDLVVQLWEHIQPDIRFN